MKTIIKTNKTLVATGLLACIFIATTTWASGEVLKNGLEPLTEKDSESLGQAGGCSWVKVINIAKFELGKEPYLAYAKKAAVKINGKLISLKAEDKEHTKFSNKQSKVRVWVESVEGGKYDRLHLKIGDAAESEPMNVYAVCGGFDD